MCTIICIKWCVKFHIKKKKKKEVVCNKHYSLIKGQILATKLVVVLLNVNRLQPYSILLTLLYISKK